MTRDSHNTLLTATEVARKCDAPTMRLIRAIKAGRIQPDFTTRHFQLFAPTRLPELKTILAPASRDEDRTARL